METAKRTKTRTAKLSASYITEVGIMTEADTASIVSNDLSLTIYSLLENECTSNIHLLDTKRWQERNTNNAHILSNLILLLIFNKTYN